MDKDGEPGLRVCGSGGCGQFPQPGQDLGEQAVAGRQPQDQVAGVADQPAGDGDQPPAQGGDHGLAAAYAVPRQDVLAGGNVHTNRPLTPPLRRIGRQQSVRWGRGGAKWAGGLLAGIAAAQLAEEDFLTGLDRQRADAAGQLITPVPGLASTTAAGLARRITPAQWTGVERGLAAVTGRCWSCCPRVIGAVAQVSGQHHLGLGPGRHVRPAAQPLL